MFDGILGFGNREEKKELASEQRQMGFVRSRDVFAAANDSSFGGDVQKSDLIRWQQELADELDMLKHRLKGEVVIGDSWVLPEGGSALCNDWFIGNIETQIIPFFSRSMINSNLDERTILLILKNTSNDLADLMSDSYDKTGIDFVNYDQVLRIIKNVMVPAAYRALNGWTKRQDSTMVKRIESSSDNVGVEQKKGFLGIGG
jgi:hypothetical protein